MIKGTAVICSIVFVQTLQYYFNSICNSHFRTFKFPRHSDSFHSTDIVIPMGYSPEPFDLPASPKKQTKIQLKLLHLSVHRTLP